MELEFILITDGNYELLRRQMSDYYRAGEDADTPQEEIDAFILGMYEMMKADVIRGRMLRREGKVMGFVLWGMDRSDMPFSEIPGYGTILEIGVDKAARKQGFGRQAVEYAQRDMKKSGAKKAYVLSYGEAAGFWQKCGYKDTGRVAGNGLPLCEKRL